MKQEFNPPRYTWTAETAGEAKDVLRAVEDLIDAHLVTLAPGRVSAQFCAAQKASAPMTVSLDLGPLVAKINDERAETELGASFGDGA